LPQYQNKIEDSNEELTHCEPIIMQHNKDYNDISNLKNADIDLKQLSQSQHISSISL